MNTKIPAQKVGGKAANLAHLSQISSIRVPKWICLSADLFWQFLGEKAAEFRKLLHTYRPQNQARIIELLQNCKFDEETKIAIIDYIYTIFTKDIKFAVRSSATDEDSEKFSFAGMLDSKLNVASERIFWAIKQCYLSGFSERAMTYRVDNDLLSEDIAVAVIIQEMIEADYAGVMFTTNPKTNDPDEVQISLVKGLGEKLVSGESDSSDFVVNILGEITDGHDRRIEPEILAKLAEQAIVIEKSYNPRVGKDIEFAIRNDQIFILQCRTITKYAAFDKNLPRTILDNSNIIESYAGVTTPLTFSFAREVYSKVYRQTLENFFIPEKVLNEVQPDLDQMLAFCQNKIYYRLNSWYKLMSLYPNYEKNKKYMESMMGVKTPLKESASSANRRLVKIYGSFIRKMLTLKKRSQEFLATFDRVVGPYRHNAFDGVDNKQLLKIYDELEAKILNEFAVPIENDIGLMIFHGMILESLEQHKVPDPEGALSDLLAGQGNVESARQAHELAELAKLIRTDSEMVENVINQRKLLPSAKPITQEVADRYTRYLQDFGERSMDELKLETITMRENPQLLIDMLANYLQTKNLDENIQPTEHRFKIKKYYSSLERIYFQPLLTIVKFLVRNREILRLRRTYIYDVVRNIYLAMGRNFAAEGLLKQQRDIFFLTRTEITKLANTTGRLTPGIISDTQKLIEQRKREFARNNKKETFERIYFYGDMTEKNALPIFSAQEVAEDEHILQGVAGGGRTVEGIVKYVESPKEADVSGYILMAKRTDPGWTVLFPMAEAIIVERGSTLSHSAVIARELGLTLVVGARGLTNRVHDGDRVRVDGVNGTIEILEHKNG